MKRYIFFFQIMFCMLGAFFQPALALDINTIQVLDIETAQKIALADNPSLAAAEDRVRQARERVLQARAAYWPRLDATASGARAWLSDSAYESSLASARIFDPAARVDDPEDYYKTGITATWLLFDGFERKFSNASARYGEKESEWAKAEARRLLLSSVAMSYYGAQLARENIAIAKANEAFNQRQVEDAKARQRIGTGSLSDVLNFEVQINAAKAELINAKQEYEVALFGLAAILGISDAKLPPHLELAPLGPETSAELDSPAHESLITYARACRPDIRQKNFALRRATSDIGLARARFYPTLNLSASAEGERAGSASFEEDDFGNTVSLNLSYNLFAGGANMAQLREARHKKAEAEKNLKQTQISVTSEVRRSIAKLEAAQKQMSLQRLNADLVRQNRDLVEKEYAAGQTSLVRLNEAQRDLITAQGRLALALVSLRQAWHDLEVSTGRILLASEGEKE